MATLVQVCHVTAQEKKRESGKLAENLRKYREAAGLTQTDLARAVGLKSTSGISDAEAGRQGLGPRFLRAVADRLGVSVADLLGHSDSSPLPVSRETPARTIGQAQVDAALLFAEYSLRVGRELGELRAQVRNCETKLDAALDLLRKNSN